MKTNGKFVGMIAAMMILFGIMVSVTAAAQPVMAGDTSIDSYLADPIFALGLGIIFFGGLVIIVPALMKHSESKKLMVYGVIIGIAGCMVLAYTVYVPDDTTVIDPNDVITTTTYALIVNPSNQTAVGSSHPTYYTWGADVNTTTGAIANTTGALTTNITISRTGGSVTDKVNCYISESDIPTSDLGFDVIAKNSGIFRIAWASDGGASVTGLNKCTVNFPAETELSAHYATCGVYLSAAALDNMADDGIDSFTYTMTFESDLIGVIGTINVNVVINAFV